jgi:rare lipoprotein A
MNQSRHRVHRRRGRAAILVAGAMAALLGGCAETQLAVHTAKEIAGSTSAPVESGMGAYKVGKPYQIQGKWYYPAEDMDFVEEGTASWYGPNFHGKLTANGEAYDMNALTAAHRTLPMPSLVRVTNLRNGRAVVLRVNDRGPFAKDRVIDVSRRAAQLLGFQSQGTTRVRVEILPEESRIAKVEAINRSGPLPDMQAAPRTTVTAQSLEPAVTVPAAQVTERPRSASFALVSPAAAAEAPLPGGAFVQAGAFSDMRNAESLSARLAGLAAVTISPVTVNGRDLYRVRLGPLEGTDLDRVLTAVRAEGLGSARVVME